MTTPKPYTPQRDSLPAYVCGYFKNNADEELTLEDITEKFAASRGNIHTQLRLAVEAGLLNRYTNVDGEYLYAAGPALANAANPAADTPNTVSSGSHHKPRTPSTVASTFDIASIVIEDGVPIPSTRHLCDMLPILQKLTPGQSVKVPLELRHMLQKHITQAHKARTAAYTLRADKAGQTVRVWRTQ